MVATLMLVAASEFIAFTRGHAAPYALATCATLFALLFFLIWWGAPGVRARLERPDHAWGRVRSVLWSTGRIVALTLALVAILLGSSVAGGQAYLIQPTLPTLTGTLALPGLEQSVTVLRDGYGVPYIYASNLHDLTEAQGYVSASDRFYEMYGAWQVATGHLAEMYGGAYLQQDEFMRALSFDAASQAEYARLDSATRRLLDAYAEGVNAYVNTHRTHLPLEFLVSGDPVAYLNGSTPLHAWTGVMTLDILDELAFSFSDWYTKLVYGAVVAHGGAPLVGELYPASPTNTPTILGENTSRISSSSPSSSPSSATDITLTGSSLSAMSVALTQVATALAKTLAPLGLTSGHMGSNNWALDATRTLSGGSFQTGTPHVPTNLPAFWEQVGLMSPQENAIGATVPGVPGILLGHNQALAFSMTISDLSDADLYILRRANCPAGQYRYNGACLPFRIRRETLMVAGGAAVTQTIEVTQTGASELPLQAPTTATGVTALPTFGSGTALALQTTLTDPTAQLANVLGLAQATTWPAFLRATDRLPLGLNWVVALANGQIGYRMSGVLPIRPAANVAGPVDGSTSATAWHGDVPQSAMPQLAPGKTHILVSANNQVQTLPIDGVPIGDYPDQGFRAQRITDLLDQLPAGTATLADMQRIQNDVYSIPASELTPTFVAVGRATSQTSQPPSSATASPDAQANAQAAQLMSGWNDAIAANSTAATVYEATMSNLVRLVVEPALGATLYSDYVVSSPDEGSGLTAVALAIVEHPERYFLGQSRSKTLSTRNQFIAEAERQAIASLKVQFGSDPHQWAWGQRHLLILAEPGLGDLPVLGRVFSLPAQPRLGDEVTVEMGGVYNQWLAAPDYTQTYGPFYEQDIDMRNQNSSRWILAPGASGQPFSPHFGDQLPLWEAGQTLPMILARSSLAQAPSTQTLTLTPTN